MTGKPVRIAGVRVRRDDHALAQEVLRECFAQHPRTGAPGQGVIAEHEDLRTAVEQVQAFLGRARCIDDVALGFEDRASSDRADPRCLPPAGSARPCTCALPCVRP